MTTADAPVRGCTGKVKYDDRPHAERALTMMRKLYDGAPGLHPYRCPFCGWHHLGRSQPTAADRARAREAGRRFLARRENHA